MVTRYYMSVSHPVLARIPALVSAQHRTGNRTRCDRIPRPLLGYMRATKVTVYRTTYCTISMMCPNSTRENDS